MNMGQKYSHTQLAQVEKKWWQFSTSSKQQKRAKGEKRKEEGRKERSIWLKILSCILMSRALAQAFSN